MKETRDYNTICFNCGKEKEEYEALYCDKCFEEEEQRLNGEKNKGKNVEKFDLEEFKELFNMGDNLGLIYIEQTIIADMIKKDSKTTGIYCTKEDYIISLFRAVHYLNNCNYICEMSDKARNFKQDLYFETRNLLFEELGIDISELRKWGKEIYE